LTINFEDYSKKTKKNNESGKEPLERENWGNFCEQKFTQTLSKNFTFARASQIQRSG
jgi:hypothetical protein